MESIWKRKEKDDLSPRAVPEMPIGEESSNTLRLLGSFPAAISNWEFRIPSKLLKVEFRNAEFRNLGHMANSVESR